MIDLIFHFGSDWSWRKESYDWLQTFSPNQLPSMCCMLPCFDVNVPNKCLCVYPLTFLPGLREEVLQQTRMNVRQWEWIVNLQPSHQTNRYPHFITEHQLNRQIIFITNSFFIYIFEKLLLALPHNINGCIIKCSYKRTIFSLLWNSCFGCGNITKRMV
jgi:hypothetical protein